VGPRLDIEHLQAVGKGEEGREGVRGERGDGETSREKHLKRVEEDRRRGLEGLEEAAARKEPAESELIELGSLAIDHGVLIRDEKGRPIQVAFKIPEWAAERLGKTFKKIRSEARMDEDGTARCEKCGDELPIGGWFNMGDGSGPYCGGCVEGFDDKSFAVWLDQSSR